MAATETDQTIFITGGTGFLGHEIVRAFREAHPTWSIISFDINDPDEARRHDGVNYITGDMLDANQVKVTLEKTRPTAVVHTAGIVTPVAHRYGKKLRSLVHKINVDGTKIVLEAALESETVKAFIGTGSCCAVIDDFRYQYPNVNETWATTPDQHNTVYGESKAIAEELVLKANRLSAPSQFLTCSLRPCTLFGDSDSQLLSNIHALIATGETPFVIGDGLNLWDVCHASNVADAHVLAADNLLYGDKRAAGEAFFIGNEEPMPFRSFCLAVWREFGHVPWYEIPLPTNLAWVVGMLSEWVSWAAGRDPALRRESVEDATATRYADGKKAREILGYKARLSLSEGIARSCRFYKQSLERRAAEGGGKKMR